MIFAPSDRCRRLKWAFASCKNGAWGTEPDAEQQVVCIRAADFDGKLGRLNNGERTLRSVDPETYEKLALRPGDIVLEKSGGGEKQPVGRAALFDGEEPSITSNFLARCRPMLNMEPAFLNYLLLAIYNARGTYPHLKQSTGIQNLDIASFLNVRIFIPSLDSQRRVSRFLDEKIAKIDRLIEKKRELLDRLAEKRQALITGAVTKGLNPDALAKPSGIEHLGDTLALQAIRADGMSYFGRSDELPEWVVPVPDGWGRSWLKWSVDLSTRRPTEAEKKVLPYISNEDIESWTGKLLIEEPKPTEADCRTFQDNDVLFNKLRPYLAKVYHARFDGVSSGELLCLRPSRAVEPRFLFYVLASKGFIDAINAETFGAKMPRADWEIVGHQPLPLPPLGTQQRIARFLDEKMVQIDELAEKIRISVVRLEEYRSAQINAAVTGQHMELR